MLGYRARREPKKEGGGECREREACQGPPVSLLFCTTCHFHLHLHLRLHYGSHTRRAGAMLGVPQEGKQTQLHALRPVLNYPIDPF